MTPIFLMILGLQAVAILVDEFYFHWQRRLPRWERWGHPLDTLFMILPMGLLAFVSDLPFWIYVATSVFSCLFITKDEWVHSQFCSPFENWLHAVLFVLHPLVLVFAWLSRLENPTILFWILPSMGIFLLYQFIYWNIYDTDSVRS